MSYATLMVHLELGRSNAGLLQIAVDLAERFQAKVIGIAARQPLQMVYGDGYVSGDLFERDREEICKEMKDAEAEFRIALQPRVPVIEWRSTQTFANLADYLCDEARCADLIVTGVASGDMFDSSRAVDTGALVMEAGKPVLLVPKTATSLKLERVLVAWKDSRETRRAVADAVPLMKRATQVSVVEIATAENLPSAQQHVADVVAWLKCHAIKAEGRARVSTGDDAAGLYAVAQDQGADVVVAGAYGHSRLREWVLGGVTRDLLLSADRCSFISH
jgi:nucleotide-binding universal stress UspA family protein